MKYILTIKSEKDKVMWNLLESNLAKLARDVEEACGVPFTIEKQTSSESEARMIRQSHLAHLQENGGKK